MESAVLVINSGSSSLKLGLFSAARDPSTVRTHTLSAGRTGNAHSDTIRAFVSEASLVGIGHRVVHGGPDRYAPELVTPQLLAELDRAVPLAPNHLPATLDLLRDLGRLYPTVPQVACYDTGFHHGLPEIAWRLPIPRSYDRFGVRRYGFHGLSFAFVLQELRAREPSLAAGALVFAHLGNGSSVVAVRNGQSIDTSMALTPLSGAMMSTRSGDIDPGLVAFLIRNGGLTVDDVEDLFGRKSGLLGVSDSTADMRVLLEREATDAQCRLAVDMYAYQHKKLIGAYAAALGRLDGLVFTGGIGEHSPAVRARICRGLEVVGVELDEAANTRNDRTISSTRSRTVVNVIPTNEELMIARATMAVLRHSI
jgi:acetate kinase